MIVSCPVSVAIQIVYYYYTRLYMRKSVVTYLVIAMADLITSLNHLYVFVCHPQRNYGCNSVIAVRIVTRSVSESVRGPHYWYEILVSVSGYPNETLNAN